MLGKGRAEKLPNGAIESLAYKFQVDPADLQAIANVESGSSAWFSDGRIKILYERHIFHKYLPASKRAMAIRQGLALKRRGGRRQYADQKTADSRYGLLERAARIDRNAAFMAVSSGRFQIMEFNAKTCGHANAEAMFHAFVDSEFEQFKAFAAFLDKNKLIPAIRDRDFGRVARVYNGDKTGKYVRKMELEASKLRGRSWLQPHELPDMDVTTRSGSSQGENDMDDLAIGQRGKRVEMLQGALKHLGYSVGDVDGVFGQLTQTALMEFQSINNLETTGVVDEATRATLAKSPQHAMASKRATANEADLLKSGSETILQARRGRLTGILASALGGLGFLGGGVGIFEGLGKKAGEIAAKLPGDIVDNTTAINAKLAACAMKTGQTAEQLAECVKAAKPTVSTPAGAEATSNIFGSLVKLIPSILGTGGSGMWLPVLAVGLYVIYTNGRIAKRRVDDHRTGTNRGR